MGTMKESFGEFNAERALKSPASSSSLLFLLVRQSFSDDEGTSLALCQPGLCNSRPSNLCHDLVSQQAHWNPEAVINYQGSLVRDYAALLKKLPDDYHILMDYRKIKKRENLVII